MNDREQFEAEFPLAIWNPEFCGYHEEMYTYALVGWRKCAESKQSELDKANKRIAQLEENNFALSEFVQHGCWMLDNVNDQPLTDGFLDMWGEKATDMLKRNNYYIVHESSDAWLSEHDKTVEVRVFKDINFFDVQAAAYEIGIDYNKLSTAIRFIYDRMIESRK